MPLGRAAELRRSFDQAFAHPPLAPAEGTENFLAVRLGGDAYAVRLSEVTELFKDRKIISIPGKHVDFLGLAGLRGDITTVHSLRGLLGYAVANEKTPWLLLSTSGNPVAFAVDQFEGHLRVDRSDILKASASASRPHLFDLVRAKDEPRPVISLRSVLDALQERAAPDKTQ